MSELEILKAIRLLVGDIKPIGETNKDNQSFENLKKLCYIVNELVSDIDDVSYNNQGRQEFSMKRTGEFASNFLTKDLGIK